MGGDVEDVEAGSLARALFERMKVVHFAIQLPCSVCEAGLYGIMLVE